MSDILNASNVTLKQIRAFVATVDAGSLTAAAVMVNSTQSSLSVLLRELEETIGLRLLDRTTRKLALTEAGEEYLVHARRIIPEFEHAHLSTIERAARGRGRVVVAAPPIMAAGLLPPIVAHFHRLYPRISMIVEDVPPGEIVPAVAAGQIDCGLGVFGDDLEGVQTTTLFKERMLLIAPAGHMLMRKDAVRWSELRGQPIIAIKGQARIRRELDIRLGLARITEGPEIEVHQMFTALGMVSAGLGVALWPSWGKRFLGSFGVDGRPLIDSTPELWLSVITPGSRGLSPAAASFLTILTDGIRNLAAEFEDSA